MTATNILPGSEDQQNVLLRSNVSKLLTFLRLNFGTVVAAVAVVKVSVVVVVVKNAAAVVEVDGVSIRFAKRF